MTNEEMRKAIAACLGWKLYQINFAMRSWVALREPGFDPAKLDKAADAFETTWETVEYLPFAWDNVPNWPEDLNAMAEVEQVFVDADDGSHGGCIRYVYARHLYNIVPRDRQPIMAKACERAQAALNTFAEWRGA